MFIPIRDDAPTYSTPYVTISLIVLNSLVFLYSISLGVKGFHLFTINYGYIPYDFVNALQDLPQYNPALTDTISSMFMHGGWIHLIGNMLFLWIYGNNVEDYFGHVRFALFYLISGLAAIALFTLFGPNSQIPLVGASGAVAGLMGAYMVLHPRARITILVIFFFIQFFTLPAKVVLGIWFVYQLLMSIMGSASGGGVAWLAHVGGFAFGYLLLRLLTINGRRGGKAKINRQRVIRMNW